MSTQPSTSLSQTLHSITAIKLRELSKQKSAFATRKASILAQLSNDNEATPTTNKNNEDTDDHAPLKSTHDKIIHLLTSIAKLQGHHASKSFDDIATYELDNVFERVSAGSNINGLPPAINVRHYLRQSQYDPSTPAALLPEVEHSLCQLLEQKEERFAYADLYSRLLTEWLESDAVGAGAGAGRKKMVQTDEAAEGGSDDGGSSDGEGGFEVVERQTERLKQLSEKFEAVVFEPLDVDVAAVEELLGGLFVGEEGQKALTKLRKRMRKFGDRMAANERPFDQTSLKWCIKGLLKSDLLSDVNKTTLEAFLKDDVVLAEIADVLTMRFVDLQSWTWDAEKEGIPVEPRRQLNGKYRVVMDEDILQSIFLHYIGTSWAVEFNDALKEVVSNRNVWRLTEHMPRAEKEKQEYYLRRGKIHAQDDVAHTRQSTYENAFFMCQLPSSLNVDEGVAGYDDDEEADVTKGPRKATGAHIKQQLLRTIGTEVLLNRSLYQQVAVVQSDLEWFATSTSHATVDTICKFFGVSSIWRKFFQRYLAAPLRMVGLEGQQGEVRTRKRGVPIGHVFQKLFGELIVFSMDLAVNQEANMLLYRLHDDLWLCGDPTQCAKAWKAMNRCAKVMGVTFNQSKTGSVYITDNDVARDAQVATTLPKGRVALGFLELEAETGDWIIDQKQVDAHAKQLQKQLAECTSVFSWVQTWNSCIGRFFNFTFGEPANCFGRAHVDMILETHRRIQQQLFNNSTGTDSKQGSDESSTTGSISVTEYLKSFISARFNVSNIPDAFLYFPEEMGGLGLRNPFIPFLVVRDGVIESPQKRMEQFFKAEKKAYNSFMKEFQNLDDRDRAHKLVGIVGWNMTDGHGKPFKRDKASAHAWSGPADEGPTFLPWEEFVRYRISSSSDLEQVYNDLLATPYKNEIQAVRQVSDAINFLAIATPELAWDKMSSERKWLVQMYAKEVFKRFGGLNLVDKGALPIGVLKVVRGRKVVWQSVL